MTRRVFPFCIALALFATNARAALIWTNNLDAAIRRARDEKKVVLVVIRSRATNRMLAEAEKHEALVHSLEAFVLALVDARALGRRRISAPGGVVFLDPAGEIVAAPKYLPTVNYLGGLLIEVRERVPAIVQASESRLAGRIAEADLILGNVDLELDRTKEAIEKFERAAKTLHAQNDSVGAQLAEINAGFAHFISGHPMGVQMVERAIRSPESDENAAEAWFILGSIRRIERNERDAIKAFRNAWDLAPPDAFVAAAARSALESLDKRPIPLKAGMKTAIVRVIPPARKVVTGSVEFMAEVDGPADAVDFYLDDVKVATATKQPFAARVDVGNIPRARNVKAVARDARGVPLGEALATINDRADAFHVSITSPAIAVASGDVMIEADAQVPDDRRLTKLELFWKNSRLATFTAPPFRIVFVMPKDFGYLRAVGTLDDGATAEDTRLMNAGGVSEVVNVQGVTFIATVLGKENKRVTGLAANDFVVEEEGKRVDVTTRASDEEAATVGIAIDISGSMRPIQLDLVEIASALVQTIASEKSKVFLVVFDNNARMIHPPSSDVASLRSKLLDLYAAGGTSLFDGMIFALQQFQGIEGRRALVVISDGRDVASGETADAATRLARSSGVPIYALVPHGGFATGNRFGNALSGIAESTGGLLFFAPPKREQTAIFESIRDEVRGQYVLSFVSPNPAKSGTWRKLRVDVPGRATTIRTIAGYYTP